MDSFLLIAGMDWTEVLNASYHINNTTGIVQMQDFVDNHAWNDIAAWLEVLGLIPENGQISEARLMSTNDTTDPYRMWFRV